MARKKTLLIFGYGYTAKFLSRHLQNNNWNVFVTTRCKEKMRHLKSLEITPILFDDHIKIRRVFDRELYILNTVPPENNSDPVLEKFGHLLIKRRDNLKWIGYLSTTSVYGNKNGRWVNEESELTPNLKRSKTRLNIENSWISLGEQTSIKTVIFRLAGIYGPNRSIINRLQANEKIYIVDKPGHFFNRIHVEDIVGAIKSAMDIQTNSNIFNLADDFPSTQLEVAEYAANLLKVACPPVVQLNSDLLTDMARSFYKEEKKVSNSRLKSELRYALIYPSFKEGLRQILYSSKES